MKYPEFLKKNDTIGLVAPSFGVSGFPYEDKYLSARGKFEDSGFSFVEARHLRGIRHARSASARIRARELMEMYLREDVDFVESVAGGELMLEILPYLNIEKLRKAKPKWFMGISDNTVFTYALTVLCDIASIYGPCLGSFGMRKWDKSIKEAYEIINGQRLKQKSYAKYELPENSKSSDDPLSGYYKTKPVVYHSLDGNDVTMKGRLVGGCLDILLNICGTRFDRVREFGEKYRDDGIIFYLEACDLNILDIYRGVWQLKNAGWFDNCTGIIMGRPQNGGEMFDVDIKEVLKNNLKDLNIPVVYGADFGHVPPSWTIINGSIGTVRYKNGKCSIEYELR
ncbi:MAG: LD-carboxypeptidase [Erysipelotrichaceae bacterium]|nr:LD-carboxypeptidase [Erysipelotrichaceae bacterium]